MDGWRCTAVSDDATGAEAIRTHTGTTLTYRHVPYGRDGGSLRRQDAPARRGGTTASGASGGGYTGDSARRSRIRGRGAAPRGRGVPRVSALGRPPTRTGSTQLGISLWATDAGMRDGHGDRPGVVASAAEWRAPVRAVARDDVRGMQGRVPPPSLGTPHGDAATAPGPLRRRPTETHVSQEQRDAARDGDRFRRPGAARWSRPTAIGRRSALRIGRVRRATGTDGCSAATMPGSPSRRPVPRASCGMSSGTPGSLACISPATPIPSSVMCVVSISRTWMSAMGARAGWSVGSPRPAPSCGGRARTASAPATRTGRTTSSSAGTRWTGPGATARLARRAGICTTRRAGCT